MFFVAIGLLKKTERISQYKMFKINNYNYMKKRKERDSSLYRDYKLFLSEDWFEVVRIDCSIASIFPFRVNISLSSKNI